MPETAVIDPRFRKALVPETNGRRLGAIQAVFQERAEKRDAAG
ncbi:MAG: hypothetical protein ACXWW8_02655 [Solirubrobacterales bacterium]